LKQKLLPLIIFLFCSFGIYAQTNRIKIDAVIDDKTDVIKIQQEIVFHNKTNNVLDQIYLHNWQNGFKDRKTPLSKRLIEDYKKSLYFAKEKERGFTKILNLTANYTNIRFSSKEFQEDIIKLDLNKSLNPNDSIIINATYTVKIPNAKFTGYGKTATGYYLRFWYLTPAVFNKNWQLMSNLNIDDLFMDVANYDITFKTPQNYFISSNLPSKKSSNTVFNFYGKNRTDIIINIDKTNQFTTYNTKNIDIVTDISFKGLNKTLATSILNRELDFIEKFLGKYPHQEILVDKITLKENPIYGLNQLPKFLNTFSDVFDRDITLFKALAKKYIDNTLLLNRRTDYWLTDGIQVFLLMEYVKEHYPKVKLLGSVSDTWLLSKFNFSKFNFNDKYPFVYQFITRKFLDQSLTTQLDSLSNFNRKIGNKYKAGLGMQYLNGYLGDSIVKTSIKEFYSSRKLQLSTSSDFKKIITSKTDKDLSWFFGDYINTNKKIDYTIKKVDIVNDSLKIVIKNLRNITAPVALYGVKNKKIKFKTWVTEIDSTKTVTIPKGDFDKVSLNYEQIYPEYNSLDNWKNTNKTLLNKPLQFKLVKDLSDPYYNQLFYQPVIDYNYYDGLSLGVKLHNKPIIKRNFNFKIIPKYATKSKTLTGSTSITYNQFFEKSKLQNIVYGLSASNYHYAPELSYSVFVPYVSFNFKRESLRDVGGKYFMAKLINIDKESAPNIRTKEQDKYSVLNLKYVYSKPNIIKEVSYKFNVDIASNFTKLSTDIRFRSLTSNNRQLDFRFFGGAFLNNNTTGNYFSFGLDRPSDYLFEQNYFGRSESSGIFSQQFIINDGGFKSVLPTRFANQFMFSFNSSIGVWRWLEYYNDVAFLKNKGERIYFGYENGIRFNFIHNILEVYLPMYSNLGWEINQEAYASKIRFVLTMRPSAIYNFFRRGFL
jgi:virulence-associated protein VapD